MSDAVSVALPLIKSFEGYAKRLVNDWCIAYQDVAGIWTIGYGCTGPDIVQGTYWTREQADAEIAKRVGILAMQVVAVSPVLSAPENENRLAAVLSFSYNLGFGAYRASTLKRRIDSGDWATASAQFPEWNHAGGKVVPGLVARRASERALFDAPTHSVPTQAGPISSDQKLPLPDAQPGNAFVDLLSRFVSWLADKLKQ